MSQPICSAEPPWVIQSSAVIIDFNIISYPLFADADTKDTHAKCG